MEDTSIYTESEKEALTLLFQEVGDGKEVNLTAFQKYGESLSQARSFMDTYNSFIKAAKTLGKKEKFFKSAPAVVTISVVVSLLGLVVSFFSLYYSHVYWYFYSYSITMVYKT